MNIAAVRIRTTAIIDRSETYNKKAAVLPSRSIPQKANTRDGIRVIAAHKPRTSHTINTTRTMVPTTP